jgi:CRISPR-associated protein Cmr1
MPNLKIVLEIVTPIFLSGADNRTPELRPPSFRGAMRYWLRALVGAGVGSDLDELRCKEEAVFGSTGVGSPIVILTSPQNLSVQERLVVPHSRGFRSKAWVEGGSFDLTLTPRPGQLKLPDRAEAALLLMLTLGGIGKRSRRGFGSLQATKAVGFDEQMAPLLNGTPKDGEALVENTRTIWNRCKGKIPTGGSPYGAGDLPDYPVLSEHHAKILVCRHAFGGTDYHQAMIDFWDRLRKPKYRAREDAFGYAKGRRRRASPLILHIAHSHAGYHLVMTAFKSGPEPLRDAWSTIQQFLDERAGAWDGEFILGGGITW